MDEKSIRDLIHDLAKDELRNCSLIHFLLANPVISIDRRGESVLVRGRSDHVWIYVSSASPDELNMLSQLLSEGDDYYAVMEEWMVPILRRNRKVAWRLPMVRFALPAYAALPESFRATDALTPDDAAWMYEQSNYRAFLSIEYTRERILGGPTVAIRENGRLVAWAMTQDDGAMGFLHVVESSRKKGYGRLLTVALASELRRLQRLPFAYISEHNTAAIALVTGLGFVRDREVEWFQLEA